jgi:general secretion pathway protein D
MLNFKDATVDSVLEYLSEATGLAVIREVAVEGRVTVFSLQPLSVDEAVSLLSSVLKEKGYAAIRMGRTLKVVTLEEAKKSSIPVRAGGDPTLIEATDEVITQVIPVRFADAVRLRQDLAPLIPSYAELAANQSTNSLILTDTGANVRRIAEIVRALDTHMATVAEVKVFQLANASATSAASLINQVFQEQQSTQQRQGGVAAAVQRFFGPGGPGGPGQQQQQQQTSGAPTAKVTASADERTNAVVVSGPPDVLVVIERVLKDLDSNPAEQEAVMVYAVRNATAKNLQTVLTSLFVTSQRTATGGGTAGRVTGATGVAGLRIGQVSTAATQAAAGLAGSVYTVADADSNSLLILTAPKNFDRVRQILEELDRPVPQVLIKVLIAEVSHVNTLDLGTEFSVLNLATGERGSALFTDLGVATQLESGVAIQQEGLIYRLVHGDVTAAIRVLEQVGKTDVLSRPYILGSDNQPATITVGQNVPFITNSRTTETGQTINTIQYQDIGIILKVTPHINPDGLVILDVAPEISSLTNTTVPISETVNATVYSKRSAQSRVAIRDGQTIVIGGLMEDRKGDETVQIPILGDIPLVGALFRRSTVTMTKTELLIFLTPHVAARAELLQGMSEQEREAIKIVPDAVKPGAFDEHMEGMKRGAPTAPSGTK